MSSSEIIMMPDWSLLPEELLHVISKNLDNCFDVVHARSVCSSWRSSFPFPACLLRPSYSLPTFAHFPLENEDLCTLERIPLFLFSVKSPPAASPSEFFLGSISQDESVDHMELPSPLQCLVKVKIPGSEPALVNMLDCQIFPLGHQNIMIRRDPEGRITKQYRGVAFLPLNKERGGGEFIVLLNYTNFLLMLRSAETRWIQLKQLSIASCQNLVPFRGRFYATVSYMDCFVIDPYSLEVTPLMPLQARFSLKYLVPSGDDDELFLVEKIIPDTGRFNFRVSRLDEKAGKWVEVNDLGGRVFFIGHPRNVSCCAKDLPNGFGVSGDSLVFFGPGNVIYPCKYLLNTGLEEDDLNFWRSSGENHVMILSTYSGVEH